MSESPVVYTEDAKCQDCYKCVRHCPVKSIRVKEHSAQVDDERCVACGRCVSICPVGAKKTRQDGVRLSTLLREKKVIASLAPALFDGVGEYSRKDIFILLQKLGFWRVSETALGAEIVANSLSKYIKDHDSSFFLSTACPTAVSYIQEKYPDLVDYFVPVVSPMVAHARFLKSVYGDGIGVVFIGPCIAKKKEGDLFGSDVDLAISWDELMSLKDELPESKELIEDNSFVLPYLPDQGRQYPLVGGMFKNLDSSGVSSFSLNDLNAFSAFLDNFDVKSLSHSVFVELLACPGGCINGPGISNKKNLIEKQIQIQQHEHDESRGISTVVRTFDKTDYHVPLLQKKKRTFTPFEIERGLARIGKRSQEDELNCGGCGHDNCKDFVRAMLGGIAEAEMCVSYMRRLAHNKAKSLMNSMPNGVMIADQNLNIVECNEQFSKIAGGEFREIYESISSLTGINLQQIFSFSYLFQAALNNEETISKKVKFNNKFLQINIFPVDGHDFVGALFLDVTTPVGQKEEIISKTEEVIRKNLATVQQIAYLLGENAAETETTLNSIIESFGTKS